MADVHERLIALFNEHGARYHVIEHAPEGRSEAISRIRGNHPSQAMKAIVVSVRGGGGGKRNALAVIPGDRRLDMKALLGVLGAQKGRFTTTEEAEKLSGCVMGAVPPFSFRKDLPLIVDNECTVNAKVVFNAGRLDRSVFIALEDYVAVAKPRFADISGS